MLKEEELNMPNHTLLQNCNPGGRLPVIQTHTHTHRHVLTSEFL